MKFPEISSSTGDVSIGLSVVDITAQSAQFTGSINYFWEAA